MITAAELVDLVRLYNPHCNQARIYAAYAYAERMHHGQYRRSGEAYFSHPVAVAAILADQHLDDSTIITALLHDTIEDTGSTLEDLRQGFGDEIAHLVDGVTKLTHLRLGPVRTQKAENLRKLFMAMSRDIRVMLVKLADRLHNMRTIGALTPDKQRIKANETFEIFAPLAGRMGMQWMREELEDLAFSIVDPKAHATIKSRLGQVHAESGDTLMMIREDMCTELEAARVNGAEVMGRTKKPYSIWRKMQSRSVGFSRLSDVYGFRIITRTEEDCYRALGAIHRRWRAVPDRIKDYISQPKSNGYRSIHSTVSGRNGMRVEVQIRTRQMNEVAETGIAAHWSYRDGVRISNPLAIDPKQWAAWFSDQFAADDDHESFLEAVKLEMYSNQVFCYTPKGDVVKLPSKATPLDFAYQIHTSIGAACVSARVDGARVPLWTRLRNGQSVEIITAQGQTPQAVWLDLVTTAKARTEIRRSLRRMDRSRQIRLGLTLLEAAFDHVGRSLTNRAIANAASKMGIADRDELLSRIGTSELTTAEVIASLYPRISHNTSRENAITGCPVIDLKPGQVFDRAQCCQPLPGERIVGISVRGRGVVIHAIDCERLLDYEDQPDRWNDLHWLPGRHPANYNVTLNAVISNHAGVLGRVCTLIGEQKSNISNLRFIDCKPDFFRLLIDVDLRDDTHMHSVLAALEVEDDVAEIMRHRDFKQGRNDAKSPSIHPKECEVSVAGTAGANAPPPKAPVGIGRPESLGVG